MSATPPCRTCPWRVTQDASEIPGFGLEKAEALANTCGSPGNDLPIGSPMFACHQSRTGDEIPCAGWLASVGNYHLGVRVAIMDGRFDPESITPDDSWPELEPDFTSLIEKLRRTA